MIGWNQKGNVLLYAVIAMTAISVLGTGIYFMTTTATFSGLGANDQNRAYQLAVAGRDYALVKNLGNTTVQYPNGRNFTLANGDKFVLKIGVNNPDEIISTGIVRQGTPYETKRSITITKSGFSTQTDISFTKDIQSSFTAPAQSQSGFITKVTGADQISLGKTSMTGTFGALWYQGSAASGNCIGGRCKFGTGFRAFFVFQYGATSTGDGFTFTFFNGDEATNNFYSVGGDTGSGELLGYAGDSRTATGYLDGSTRTAAGCPGTLGCAAGRGIQPPKMAIEFDPYTNYGTPDVCASGSRRDGDESPNPRNHVGYVFWGDNTNSSCDSTIGRNTYDDNRHNNGTDSSSDPRNSRRLSDGTDPSYYNGSATWPYNWLLSNTPTNIYAFRLEVTRSPTPNAGGNYEYTVKSWIKQCTVDIACTTYDAASNFANTKVDYTGDTATLTSTRTTPIQLTPALHNKFDTFFFGWTTATGGATQNILINRFKINFSEK
jgi:hypothetical protein